MPHIVPQWSRFELEWASTQNYDNPLQDVLLVVTFVSDTGMVRRIDGFWDGGNVWRARFSPPVQGRWRYTTECSDPRNLGLHGRTGTFICGKSQGGNRFRQHGTVRVASNGRYLAHADGTPFFYLADTVWNGPLCSTDDEWRHYLNTRVSQGFTAAQWVATQWISAPHGDHDGRLPFTGHERITVHPEVFQRLDSKLDAMNDAGLLGVTVLLWAAEWGDFEVMRVNPGLTLPEDQAVLLARYMIARWGANDVLWILGGDAEYRGAKAERWRQIGRAVFGGRDHAPVALHPNGMSWHADEFHDETWLDLIGYQGCHFGDDNALTWAVYGPPASEWRLQPSRPIINLEPPYENHVDLSNPERRFSADDVRRAVYWSLLVSPTAGVTYGGHGVWGWDDGTTPPTAHPGTGIPLPWREALLMPGAQQMRHVADSFQSIAWWELQPAPDLIETQPGDENIRRAVVASRSERGDLAVIYVPEDRMLHLRLDALREGLSMIWLNPRTGQSMNGGSVAATGSMTASLTTPEAGDWLLILHP
jgi:hypothetical protein